MSHPAALDPPVTDAMLRAGESVILDEVGGADLGGCSAEAVAKKTYLAAAAPAFLSNALAILPLSRLEMTSNGPGRLTARSRRGALPSAADLHAGSVARATDGDGAAVLADLGRKLVPMLRAARADLAATKAVLS